jgi:hypothetical protein
MHMHVHTCVGCQWPCHGGCWLACQSAAELAPASKLFDGSGICHTIVSSFAGTCRGQVIMNSCACMHLCHCLRDRSTWHPGWSRCSAMHSLATRSINWLHMRIVLNVLVVATAAASVACAMPLMAAAESACARGDKLVVTSWCCTSVLMSSAAPTHNSKFLLVTWLQVSFGMIPQ